MKSSRNLEEIESTESSKNIQWILNFMALKENRYLEIIEDSFLRDKFNLTGLSEKLLDFENSYSNILHSTNSDITTNEESTYLMIHQRYVFSRIGADSVLGRVMNKDYGTCQRYGCENISLIPSGLSCDYGIHKTMVYCYSCKNLFIPKGCLRNIDGCAWGKGYANFLILTFPENFPKKKNFIYQPRLFGFRIGEKNMKK